jgi:hypothetical protein
VSQYCETCGGHACLHSNHICKTTPLYGFPVDDVPTAEEIAAMKQQDEECRGVAARIAVEIAEIERERLGERATHDRKQLELARTNKQWMEERKRAADVTTNNLNFDVKE